MKIKKKVALSGLLLCCAITAKAQVCITPQVEQRARELVSQMTLEEKIDYISGPKSFYIRAVPRLGIPEIRMAAECNDSAGHEATSRQNGTHLQTGARKYHRFDS